MKLSQRAKIYPMSDLILTSFFNITRTKGTRNKTWFPTIKLDMDVCIIHISLAVNKTNPGKLRP